MESGMTVADCIVFDVGVANALLNRCGDRKNCSGQTGHDRKYGNIAM